MNNKLFARIAAAAIGVSMLATVAFAAPVATKDDVAGTASLNFVVDGTDISESSEAQVTMMAYLVDDADYTSTPIPAYSDQEIVALDQVSGEEGFDTVTLDISKLVDGKIMVVKLGGSDGTVETFAVKYNADAGEDEEEILLGDVDGDGFITSWDGYYMTLYELGDMGIEIIMEDVEAGYCQKFWDENDETYAVKRGDVDGDGFVTSWDGYYVTLYELGDMGIEIIMEDIEAGYCQKFWKD